jgi:hypothetical protein
MICKTLLLSLVLFSSHALANTLSAERYRHISTLTVKDLPVLNKKPISDLSVQAIIDGELQPIPFQIDEMNQKGNFYYEAKEAPILGELGLLDEKDELVFMYHDTGIKISGRQPKSGKILLEVKFEEDGETRFAYIIEGSADRSQKKYVDYNVKTGLIKSDFYTLEIDPDNLLNWKSHTYKNFNEENKNLIDTLKIRISGGLFTPWAKVSLNNENLKPEIIGIKHGPVRSIVKMDTEVRLGGISVPMINLMLHYYFSEQQVDAPVLAGIPALGLLLKVLKEPSISVSLDFNKLEGSLVTTAKGPKEAAVVDGKMSKLEEQFAIEGITGDISDLSSVKLENNFLYMDTQNGYEVLALLDIFPESLEGNDPGLISRSLSVFGDELGVLYHDDKNHNDKPEQFPGAYPEAGYLIGLASSELDSGELAGRVEIRFAIKLFFIDDIGEGGPAKFEHQVRNPPQLSYTIMDENKVADL